MQPINQNNYYAIFQTGLLIALEEMGVKQAHLAALCGISAGHLSRLKGWRKDNSSETLLAKPHVIKTNFKRLAVPLMQFLEQEHQIRFSEGFFVLQAGDSQTKQWGEFSPSRLPDREINTPAKVSKPDILDGIELPKNGTLSIEVTVDLSDKDNLADILKTLRFLNNKHNVDLQVKFTLFDSREQRTQEGFMPSAAPEPDDVLSLYHRKLPLNRNINLQVQRGGNGFSGFVSTKDALTGAQREQFCDYSDWESLQQQGDWDYSPDMRIIHGGGIHQYLLSRYRYGAHPFNLQAVLRFDGYAQHAVEPANAGIILGWQNIKGQNQYYNLLLDGQTMRLELVGAEAGNHYADFQHLDAGAPFVIEDQTEYQFLLRVTPKLIQVFVGNNLCYAVATPAGMEGMVGIRPWRAQVTCSYFEIWEGD